MQGGNRRGPARVSAPTAKVGLPAPVHLAVRMLPTSPDPTLTPTMPLHSRTSALALGALVVTALHAPAWAQAPAPTQPETAAAAPAAPSPSPAAQEPVAPAPAPQPEPATPPSDRPVAAPTRAVLCHPESVLPCHPSAPAGLAPGALPMSDEQRQLQRRLALRHWALAGVTGVLGVGGIVFGLQSRASLGAAQDARWQVEAYDTLRKARGEAVAANALFAGAGLAAVAGVITYFISPPLPVEEPQVAGAVSGGKR